MSNSSAATNHAKLYNSNFAEENSSPHHSDAMIDSNSTVSSYGYTNTNKGQKHLINELNRRTSQRKRAKVGQVWKQQDKNRSIQSEVVTLYVNIWQWACSKIYIFSGNQLTFKTKMKSKIQLNYINFQHFDYLNKNALCFSFNLREI